MAKRANKKLRQHKKWHYKKNLTPTPLDKGWFGYLPCGDGKFMQYLNPGLMKAMGPTLIANPEWEDDECWKGIS